MTEIKHRGYLTKKQLAQTIKYLKKNGKLIKAEYEETVYFDTSIFPQIGDFATGFSRVSLKSDQKGAVFRIKDGDPSDPKRNEISVAIKKKYCQNLIYILCHLGLKYGYYRPAYRQVFTLNIVIISIKTESVMGDHFEIELKRGVSITDTTITLLLKKFNLHFWSKVKYQDRIHTKMKKSPAINVFESKIWSK